jgi:hypothetical protein
MSTDIEILVSIEGDALSVVTEVGRLRHAGLKKRASITAPVKDSGGRHMEPYTLPSIIEGDGAMALAQLDRLVSQGRIDSNLERQIKEFIRELVISTTP